MATSKRAKPARAAAQPSRTAKPQSAAGRKATPKPAPQRKAKSTASRSAGARSGRPRAASASAGPGAGPETGPEASLGAAAGMPNLGGLPAGLHISPDTLSGLQAEYMQRLADMMSTASPPSAADRRFSDASWQAGPFAWGAALYSLNAEFLQKMADSVEGETKTRERLRFATQQWVDMMSPANFLLTNPEAQKKLLDTRGESLWTGIQNMLADLQKGKISQTDELAFEVGRNVATTSGSVVFQNALIQIIQYSPTTDRVGSRPLLMVPPCINKFYIMDLQPDNSLVAYAVSQGHTVFMVSWRNVQADQSRLGWDDYLEQGVIEAVRVVREISGQPTINLLGFCVGGTLVATAAAALAARGDRWIESLTLLTTLLDFSDPGVLGIFVDEAFVSYKEATIGSGGLMHGRELATTFNFLRPNDLVWNYVVSNYLKGEAPPAFDLLYWN